MESVSPRRWVWLTGNLLMFFGLYLLAFVGGVYADEAANRAAARGDSQLRLPREAAIEDVVPGSPAAFQAPNLNMSAAPATLPLTTDDHSTISRIVIPRINVDNKVIEVGWVLDNGVAVWQVAKFAVGHHQGSANPGAGSNIVLAGHVGGAAPVFARLIELEAGDQLTLYSNDQQYLYSVVEVLRVQEVGVSDSERLSNAAYMDPTPDELVTLITCWPATGPNAFDQRIIVRAKPFTASSSSGQSGWRLR